MPAAIWLELLRAGFRLSICAGIELLSVMPRSALVLPAGVIAASGDDACAAPLPKPAPTAILQSTVPSLLDDASSSVCGHRCGWVQPGGAVLWYDFTWNNPRRPR